MASCVKRFIVRSFVFLYRVKYTVKFRASSRRVDNALIVIGAINCSSPLVWKQPERSVLLFSKNSEDKGQDSNYVLIGYIQCEMSDKDLFERLEQLHKELDINGGYPAQRTTTYRPTSRLLFYSHSNFPFIDDCFLDSIDSVKLRIIA